MGDYQQSANGGHIPMGAKLKLAMCNCSYAAVRSRSRVCEAYWLLRAAHCLCEDQSFPV